MAAQRQPAEEPRENGAGPCGHCGSADTEAHCRGRACTWVKCRGCHMITDLRRARGSRG